MKNNLAKTLARYFLQGLLYLVPIAVTIYIIIEIVVILDGIIPVDIPGLGILLILLIVTLVGYLGSKFLIPLFSPFERIIEKTPLIKLIYSSIKDLMSAFVGKKKQFDKPVLVRLGSQLDYERLGFITKESLEELGMSDEKIAVYLPFSLSMSGEVVVITKKSVQLIDANAAEVMKLIVSGGVTTIESKNNK